MRKLDIILLILLIISFSASTYFYFNKNFDLFRLFFALYWSIAALFAITRPVTVKVITKQGAIAVYIGFLICAVGLVIPANYSSRFVKDFILFIGFSIFITSNLFSFCKMINFALTNKDD